MTDMQYEIGWYQDKVRDLTAENERLTAAIRPAAESVLDEFVEDLTSQQRSYIVDQIARRALEPKP